MAAETSHQHLLLRQRLETNLPAAYLIGPLHPQAHHLMLESITIPVLRAGNPLAPLQETIQLKRTEPPDPQSSLLFEFKQAQGISETEEMEKDHGRNLHAQSPQCSDQTAAELQKEAINKIAYTNKLINNQAGTL